MKLGKSLVVAVVVALALYGLSSAYQSWQDYRADLQFVRALRIQALQRQAAQRAQQQQLAAPPKLAPTPSPAPEAGK